MLLRTLHPGGIVTYQSPLLLATGVIHAFSTRVGGVSASPFESLNLGIAADSPDQDHPRNIQENFRRFQRAIGCAPHTLRAWAQQVHGATALHVIQEPANEYAESLSAVIADRFSGQLAADALVSRAANVLLTIRTADCLPILLASTDGTRVAAIHAGWRGLLAGVIDETLRALGEIGATPASLLAALGPCISAAHFEVGPDVASQFQARDLGLAVVPPTTPDVRPSVNLQRAALLQLQRAGVTRIDTHNRCTFRNADEFFSHRRDTRGGGTTGRMVGAIMVR